MTALNLPEPIVAYFNADALSGDAVADCFTKDAEVRDEGRTHVGRAAIAAWRTAATAKYHYTVEPLAHVRNDVRHIVTGRVSGNFPGSPVDLEFTFVLKRRKISFLEIRP